MALKFPKRSATHVTETNSWRILDSLAPQDWIVREVTERDYGIDAYIELVDQNDQITGDLTSAQLKGVDSIKWKKGSGTSPQIKASTAAYWLGLPLPVFLLVADIAASDVYFFPVKQAIRANYEKLRTQDSLTFPLNNALSLKSAGGPDTFRRLYAWEKLHPQFALHISNLISQIETIGDFILMNQNRDIFFEVEAERHLQFRAIYQSCQMASFLLHVPWQIESLEHLYEKDHKDWKDNYIWLHEQTLDYALQKIQKVFPELVRSALTLVTETEAAYWEAKDPVFASLCNDSDLMNALKRFEQKAE
ncbi:DUF4365 domain-containing protein [Agrobacterium pusense]|uniref:DUF4365 domain-containing protein n=1 Tax=Agrobacterium pusense TaxID=648995 RepID=UPI00384B53A7